MSWVPLRVDPDDDPGGGVVRVDAQVEGRPVEFVPDTGAASTTIPRGAGIAHLPKAGQRSSGTAFGRHTTDRVKVSSLWFGGTEHGPMLVDRGNREDG